MFSAVALLGMTVVSYGANHVEKVEINSVETIESNEIEFIVTLNDYWDCAKIAQDVYDELIQITYHEEAMDNANGYFESCMNPWGIPHYLSPR